MMKETNQLYIYIKVINNDHAKVSQILRVYLDTAYLLKIENLLLKIL